MYEAHYLLMLELLLGTKTKVRLLIVLAASGYPMTRNELARITRSGIRSTYEQIEELIAIGVLKEIEDKTSIHDTVWKCEQLTQDVFKKLQVKYGIPAHLIETLFWHLEILHRLQPIREFLVFKGGTCVQSYIDPRFQRASNDLDFNTTIENPNALMQKIEELNEQLIDREIAVEMKGIHYGINDKMGMIAGRTSSDPGELIRSSAGTVMAFGERSDEARGFASMVARGGKELIRDWEISCERTAEKIIRLV
jgi:hypothetical protein